MRKQDNVKRGGWFSRFASWSADAVGSPLAFGLSVFSIAIWAAAGPTFHYSDTWQLVMNTWTDIVTFIMVFLIQHAQNRDSKAINLKLDELIRATGAADDELVNVEKLSDDELDRLERRYARIQKAVQARRRR